MTTNTGLITELEVINSVLSVAGDNPIQSLDEDYQPVFIIRQMLNNISRDMQTKNYWFNTDYAVEFKPNTLTELITLPANLISFEPEDTRFIARGSRVYNRVDRTYIITENICADISIHLPFDELPQVARKYIQTMCRLQYNNEYFGETSVKQDLLRAVVSAEAALQKKNIENENINVLDNSKVFNIAFKNRRRN